MLELLSKAREQLNMFWQKINKTQKIKLGIVLVALLTSIILFFTVIAKPNYVPLFSDLSLSDSGEIINRLDEMKIPYKLTGNGQTIEVPSDYVYKARMKLAQEGLPRDGIIGFSDILEKSRIGTTDWERRLQYNQALQGELARTIQGIKGVDQARIHIVVPEKSLFLEPDENETARAAIFLKLNPTSDISADQIKGIMHLVSSSVEGLKPENITIIDDKGRLLSSLVLLNENSDIGFDSQTLSNQFKIQQNFQKHLELNVKSLLEQVFGPGNVAVRINAQLDFNQKIVESKLFQPVVDDQGILRSIQQMEEHFSGNSQQGAEGIPGTTSNIPGYEETNKGQSEYSRKETTKNFEVNEILNKLKVAPGSVKKLTVSVVVNKELDENEKSEIAQLVGSAIGYDPDRDKISVEGIVFDTSLQEEISKQIQAEKMQYRSMINKGLIVGSLLLSLTVIILYRWTLQRKKQRMRMEEVFAEQSSAIEKENVTDKTAEKSDLLKEIEKLARKQPENVAQIIRTWLNED
ncbi:MAG: flagellar M-ring protein FliF [Thermosediminibacterales bacterium]|nr:flagellar M-ring protein FliF [Thermosediminibacterales bacterium]